MKTRPHVFELTAFESQMLELGHLPIKEVARITGRAENTVARGRLDAKHKAKTAELFEADKIIPNAPTPLWKARRPRRWAALPRPRAV